MSSATNERATGDIAGASAASSATPVGALSEKRRLLLLVRTGLTLAIGYLLVFSAPSAGLPASQLAFVVSYLGSNVIIAALPARILASAAFDVGLILFDTVATSFALYLIPDASTDVFVFYFVIILLASITDRLTLSLLAPAVTGAAYLTYLLARLGPHNVMQAAILLRMPFFLLAGAFYAFFVDRVRRGQMAAAAAKQREQARTELLSLITHDLKQPLWVAQQSVARLYDQLDRQAVPLRNLAAQVMVSLRRMEALTLNFLDFDRIEAQVMRVFPRRASLNRVVKDLVDSYGPVFEWKRLRVRLDLDPALPPILIDPPQLERSLANLLDNAIKYTQEGGSIVCRTARGGDGILLTIGDSGPGIGSERAATLFTRYQNGKDIAGRRSTGLGLYIARAIVVAHGGDITLDPTARPGAWFNIRLPLAPGESTAACGEAEGIVAARPVAAA